MGQKNVPGSYSSAAREHFMKNRESIEFTPKSFTSQSWTCDLPQAHQVKIDNGELTTNMFILPG